MFDAVWVWIGFNLFVLALLALDLGVFHRDAHEVSLREAAIWSVVWISLALVFNLGLYLFWDQIMPGSSLSAGEAGLAFLTGYLIEKALSVDNIFVFVLIFSYFAVPAKYQHRVLFWGILGALIMRGTMIAAGAALIKQFHWIIWVFGAFLIFTGIRMATSQHEEVEPDKNPVVRLFRRFMPISDRYDGQKFLTRQNGVLMATPLLLVLVMVETTDLIFAVDSIPAIFAVTQDPFIVYTSNVFAILGLRALYFVLAGVVHLFHYLKLGLSVVLAFVGVKMLLPDVSAALIGTSWKIPTGISLGVVATIITVSIVASLIRARLVESSEHAAPSNTV
ncbi:MULTISPECIES: TerC family protein [Chloroflexus]|uniref:Integral membrane protein TerC n=1 Tax=Chloroflexus aurantiacus (strain ATCC 29366 / DSM 635 / J-10-fl) TaxID=324602 RepID=A9WFR9_CHLAA|nr:MULTISPECIES: TerC family protein [Chloroflexus]ABY35419.1 Integral membrane protein TerC [Chloroflexus aurantiacus J-10-fl]RMG49859.1 MAG: TerC family protein [Chloroflexota bacterium]GIV92147.1 MAG: membrane protein [Chloroflexus sp.]